MFMTSLVNFFHVNQIVLLMWSCDQNLMTIGFLQEKFLQRWFYKDLSRRAWIFDGYWSWLNLSNLGLTLGMALKIYKIMTLSSAEF